MWFTKKRTSPTPSQRRAFQPRLEILEDRCLLSGGVLDPTFGTNGVVTTNVASLNDSFASAVATYPKEGTVNDGKIVAVGIVGGQDQDLAVVRYNLDGSLDKTFGGSGQVRTSVGSSSDGAGDVIVQPDGKVVVAGWTGGNSSNFALVRYNADGSLDTSFGGSKAKGVVTTDINNSKDVGGVMALQADGKIVVAGTTIPKNSTTTVDLAIVRYNADGSLDTSFGTGGKVTRHFNAPLAANSNGGIDLAIDPSTNPLDSNAGKIVVATQLGTDTSPSPMVVLRLNTNGSPDTSFGSNGAGYVSITTLNGGDVAAVAVQSDDRIVVAGINPGTPSTGQDIGLARFNQDGTPDATFGSGGFVEALLPNNEQARSLAIQPDGKIVVAGDTDNLALPNGSHQFMVARFNAADGTLDTSFGTGGIAVSTGFNISSVDKVDMALEPDGRIVVAGTAPVGTGDQLALARFLASGPSIGSFTASSSSVTAGSILTLTASNISEEIPSSPNNVTEQVSFYYFDGSGNKVALGSSAVSSAGPWTLASATAFGLTPGTYTIYAQAEDNYGIFGDPVSLTLTVQ